MDSNIDAASVAAFHDRQLRNPDWPVFDDSQSGGWTWVAANHRYNGLLWREEDRARRLDVPASEIAASKRLIDRYKQKRKDAIEAMIDRLSILSLKIRHMRAQAQRDEAGAEHMHACACKLERLAAQRQDLLSCLDSLLLDARAGRAFFKVYTSLNPWLNGLAQERGKVAP
jgi:hypothetical protein